jgi:hypothetical protein
MPAVLATENHATVAIPAKNQFVFVLQLYPNVESVTITHAPAKRYNLLL